VTSQRSFGDALRRHREQRGVTIEDISRLTKISASLLTGLERGDCSRWPAGIYSRAYIRDYAQAVGLDRDETVARFTECFAETAFPDGPPQPKEPAAPVQPPTEFRLTFCEEPEERRRRLGRRAVVAVFDLVVSLAVATALSLVAGAGFWMALSVVSLCCHAAGVLSGGTHTWDLLARAAARRQVHSAEVTTAESSRFAEAA
jgi:transcriptional regulator with XRE-family HTH domain